MLTVEEFMSHNPVTLSRFNSLADARKVMGEKGFRHIPIVENNTLIGLVSQRNVFAHGSTTQNYVDNEELFKIESGILLADVMVTNLVTVEPSMNIADAALIVHRKKYGCLPVVDEENRLLGIITDHDFVSITIQLLDIMDANEPIKDEDF